MKKLKTILTAASLLFLIKNGIGQDKISANISTTISKIRVIQNQYRVVEKTFSDIVVAPDTGVSANQILIYSFSSSNRYHLNVFGASDDFIDLNLSIYKYDDNDKLQLVTTDGITSNDIDMNFNPTKTGSYILWVKGTLKKSVESGYFNLIISRD